MGVIFHHGLITRNILRNSYIINKPTNNMSDNNSNTTCGCFCLELVLFIVVILLICTWCERNDGKDLIDSSIEQVHHWYEHADSVWNQNDTVRIVDKNNDTK